MDTDAIFFKIHIIQIQSHTFTDSNSGSEKKGEKSSIAYGSFIMKTLLCLRQSFAVLGEIQKSRNLIWLQADDRLLVKLGHRDQGRNIPADLLGLIEILVHTANGGKLA